MIESTHGNRLHDARKSRHPLLYARWQHAVGNRCTSMVPAFSIGRIRKPPQQVRIVRGDEEAKATLAGLLRQPHPGLQVVVP